MDEKDVARLREQARGDRKLFERATQVLAEIDRSQGLSDEHADVLVALRIRLEGRRRASLDELLSTAGDISGKRDLADAPIDEQSDPEWPTIKEKKRDWPGL
ncbi:MAG: hypothetical protein M3454_16445 [Actinomycetota bacterium]|nr:hypothetical protein [Actinomycetota bacterium]